MEGENQWSVDKINKHSPSRKNYEWCSETTLGSTASALPGWCGIRCGPPGEDRACLGHREPWFCLNRQCWKIQGVSTKCQKVEFFVWSCNIHYIYGSSSVDTDNSIFSDHITLWWSSTPPFDPDTLGWPQGHWFELFTLATAEEMGWDGILSHTP